MKYLTGFLSTVLAALLSCIVCNAGCPQADTIALWNGEAGHHKKDVILQVFRPEKPNGIGIIVCPGGSYFWLDEKGEGSNVGRWLSSNGVTSFVLNYRTAGAAEFVWHTRLIFRGIRYPDMIEDAQKALQWVVGHAPEYSVRQDRIGMMGFSAGGHLVMSAACFHDSNFLSTGDTGGLDSVPGPSFVAPIYPVVTMNGQYAHKRSRRGLLGDSKQSRKTLRDSLSLEMHIPADCPPVFIINCKDDPVVDFRNSELLDSALTVKGIEHKYIQYQTGKHGFGVSDHYGSPECREWRNEFLKWLQDLFPDCFKDYSESL